MKACPHCKGDGLVYVPDSQVHPMTNIANRRFRTSKGKTGTWYNTCSIICDIGETVEWEFACYACSGRGIVEWTRGRSLTPTPDAP